MGAPLGPRGDFAPLRAWGELGPARDELGSAWARSDALWFQRGNMTYKSCAHPHTAL